MMQYLVGYRMQQYPLHIMQYRFPAMDAGHAIELFRQREPAPDLEVVYIVVEGPCE